MFTYKIEAKDKNARAGVLSTPHGEIQTPIFMPVGTKATVKWIHKSELDEMWAQIILNNTYHMYLRPGDGVVRDFWWLHSFQNYHKPILTDSGGFQVFSLWEWNRKRTDNQPIVKITEEWVHFRSVIDGSKHFFSPEKVMDIESNLWADIIMAFDECAPGESTHAYAKSAMIRTHNWLERCKKQWLENEKYRKKSWLHPQALFGIIQWVIYDDLRSESAKFVSDLDLPWIAIGGLSVWESKDDMYRIMDVVCPILPEEKPRYLMGVWTPEDLVEAIYRGIDMFDCVLPTRLGRHGKAFGSSWDKNLRNEKYKLSDAKLDEHCECKVCKNYSVGYLRHLVTEWEMLWAQLISYHNLQFLLDITKNARNAILEWKYDEFRKDFWSKKEK